MLISMKTFLISTLLALLLQCISGDISGNINQQLPLNSLTRIPSPTQSLQPPTFENPIKDYTVGLVPPPIDGQSIRDDTRPRVQPHQVQPRNHVHSNTHANGFINTARPFVNSVQQRSGFSTVHQKTHHSSNLLHPQVYQPKTAIYQPFHQHQFTAHHQPHYPIPTTYSAGLVRQPVAAVAQHNHHHKHFVSTPQYYDPVTQSRVHQHSTHTHFVSTPVQRVQHAYQQSAFVPRPVSSYSGSIIQTYPSVAYTAIPEYGSTLNFGNAQLDPELVQIISEVYGRNH